MRSSREQPESISIAEGDAPECNFNYASVVGVLLCLTGHAHPELTFTASQCGRFMHAPKRSHELALICIGQHLKGCEDDGLDFNEVRMPEFGQEQQLSFEKSDGETKSKVGRLISQFQEFAKASCK